MKKKILVIGILAAVLIVLSTMTPAVGTTFVKSDIKKSDNISPLFTVRTQQSRDIKVAEIVDANYLGKGKTTNLFPIKKSYLQNLANKAIKIIDKNPNILQIIIDKILKLPELANVLKDNRINLEDFKSQLYYFINSPDVLKEEINKATIPQENDPQPLGLSTSSSLGCFIVALIVAPIIALIGLIIATMTIITCIIPSCFENVVGGLVESFIQGLTPPEFN